MSSLLVAIAASIIFSGESAWTEAGSA